MNLQYELDTEYPRVSTWCQATAFTWIPRFASGTSSLPVHHDFVFNTFRSWWWYDESETTKNQLRSKVPKSPRSRPNQYSPKRFRIAMSRRTLQVAILLQVYLSRRYIDVRWPNGLTRQPLKHMTPAVGCWGSKRTWLRIVEIGRSRKDPIAGFWYYSSALFHGSCRSTDLDFAVLDRLRYVCHPRIDRDGKRAESHSHDIISMYIHQSKPSDLNQGC